MLDPLLMRESWPDLCPCVNSLFSSIENAIFAQVQRICFLSTEIATKFRVILCKSSKRRHINNCVEWTNVCRGIKYKHLPWKNINARFLENWPGKYPKRVIQVQIIFWVNLDPWFPFSGNFLGNFSGYLALLFQESLSLFIGWAILGFVLVQAWGRWFGFPVQQAG